MMNLGEEQDRHVRALIEGGALDNMVHLGPLLKLAAMHGGYEHFCRLPAVERMRLVNAARQEGREREENEIATSETPWERRRRESTKDDATKQQASTRETLRKQQGEINNLQTLIEGRGKA